MHVKDYSWRGDADNDYDEEWERNESDTDRSRKVEGIRTQHAQMKEQGDPLPSVQDIRDGIPHWNEPMKDNENQEEELWDVVRSIHSKKKYYLEKIKTTMQYEPTLTFKYCYPDTRPDAEGLKRLHPDTKSQLLRDMNLNTDMAAGEDVDFAFVKHIVEKHAGEVRIVGGYDWMYPGMNPFEP